ncbi:hypothetical protein KPNIH8_28583, partial [Klebsiella pneumoniae subsp. pneumoniae KPNIH8]
DLHSKERSTWNTGGHKHVIADKFRLAIPAASQHIDQYPARYFPGGRIIRVDHEAAAGTPSTYVQSRTVAVPV